MSAHEEYLRKIFNNLDQNGDGKINTNEITIDNFTGGELSTITETDFTQILNQHDSDKDGNITFDEFKAAVIKVHPLFA